MIFLISDSPGPSDKEWTQLAWMDFPVEGSSITAAELEALAGAQSFVIRLLQDFEGWQAFFSYWKPWSYC